MNKLIANIVSSFIFNKRKRDAFRKSLLNNNRKESEIVGALRDLSENNKITNEYLGQLIQEIKIIRSEQNIKSLDMNNSLSVLNNHLIRFNNDLIDGMNLLTNSMISLNDKKAKVQLFFPGSSKKGYNFFRNNDGTLSFDWGDSKRKNKIVVVTMPKSGTYFYNDFLMNLKFCNGFIHSDLNGFEDFSLYYPNNVRNKIIETYVRIPFSEQLHLLKPGYFLKGHIPFTARQFLSDEKVLCTKRNLRDVFPSLYRYFLKAKLTENYAWHDKPFSEAGFYEFLIDNKYWFDFVRNDLLKWYDDFNDYVIRFEDITDEKSKKFTECIEILSVVTGCTYEEVLESRNKVFGSKSLTYSGKEKPDFSFLWTNRVIKLFNDLGGAELNNLMGYTD